MNQSWKNKIIFWAFIFAKFMMAIRGAIDTVLASDLGLLPQPWDTISTVTNVLSLDIVFIGVWMALSFLGDGQDARRMKPFLAIATIVMYYYMVRIGMQVHTSTLVPVAVRVAGGTALMVDIWEYISMIFVQIWTFIKSTVQWAGRVLYSVFVQSRSLDVVQERVRTRALKKAHRYASKQLQDDMNEHVYTLYKEDIPSIASGRKDVTPVHSQSSTGQIQEYTEQLCTFIGPGNMFTPNDAERVLPVGRTLTYKAISHGQDEGTIESVQRGVYKIVDKVDGSE